MDDLIRGTAWARFNVYGDVGEVMELGATYDDTLKKSETFTDFATLVAQRIARETDAIAKITYGKWGARIEYGENPHLDRNGISELARRIIKHPSWTGLALATWVFTYGDDASEPKED